MIPWFIIFHGGEDPAGMTELGEGPIGDEGDDEVEDYENGYEI